MNFSLRQKLRPFYGPLYVVYVLIYTTAVLGAATVATAECHVLATIGMMDRTHCHDLHT